MGFVRVVVGGHLCDLAVQAVPFETGVPGQPGHLVVDRDPVGILVDDGASTAQVLAQIERGTAEAVRHLSRKYLN